MAEDKPDPLAFIRSVDWPEPADIEPVTGGWDTHMWSFTAPDGNKRALRVYRTHSIFFGESADAEARREEAAMRATGDTLPVPAIDFSATYAEIPFLILEWMPGRPLVEVLQRRPWLTVRLGRAFSRLQAQLHALDVSPLDEVADELADREDELLQEVRRETVHDAFCHYDFHPMNVLAKGGDITALLDFSSAGRGDRRADLGLAQAILVAAPAAPGPLRALVRLFRKRFTRAWREGYEVESGSWPLTPLFEAFGAAVYLHRWHVAIDAGTGWATQADMDAMRAYMLDRIAATGLASVGPS